MEQLSARQITRREWENISVSLRTCGNIGRFDQIADGELDNEVYKYAEIMDVKIDEHHYFTIEASYVFSKLAYIAAKKLGLEDNTAKIFGSGYSFVRTSNLSIINMDGSSGDFEKHSMLCAIFFRLFYSENVNYNWDFNCTECSRKLKFIFSKFQIWQRNNNHLQEEIINFIRKEEAADANTSLQLTR